MSKRRTWLVVIITIFATLIVGLLAQLAISWFSLDTRDIFAPGYGRAAQILGELNIDADFEYDPDCVLYYDTHGGFHGDGDTIAVVDVGFFNREIALKSMTGAEGWTIEQISADTQAKMMSDVIAGDAGKYIKLAINTPFDAWFFHDAYEDVYGAPGEGLESGDYQNYEIAFYDMETGLLFYYEFDM